MDWGARERVVIVKRVAAVVAVNLSSRMGCTLVRRRFDFSDFCNDQITDPWGLRVFG